MNSLGIVGLVLMDRAEERVAREVRHELVMLLHYFNVSDDVTLLARKNNDLNMITVKANAFVPSSAISQRG